LKQSRVIVGLLSLACVLLMSGCSTATSMFRLSEVNKGNSLIQANPDLPHATVYFIRPKTEHTLGFTDNILDVEADGEKLMGLAMGEYTMVQFKPREAKITMRTLTQIRGRWEVTEMARTRSFDFEAGKEYFILADVVNEEFRGARFYPRSISLFDAKQAVRDLEPAGQARKHPIAEL